jgi:hypothetical protein
LGKQPDHLDALRLEIAGVFRELAKLAAAIGSPSAAMEDQQEPSMREQIRQRPHSPLLIRQREAWCNLQRRWMHAGIKIA